MQSTLNAQINISDTSIQNIFQAIEGSDMLDSTALPHFGLFCALIFIYYTYLDWICCLLVAPQFHATA